MLPGKYVATIEENDIRSAGSGTEFIYIRVSIDGEGMPIQIWLTEKAMGMARAQLRQCGFDPDRDSLSKLAEDSGLLRGRQVPVEVYEEEYKGHLNLKAKIQTGTVGKKRIAALDAMMKQGGREEPVSLTGEAEDDIPF